MYGLNINNSEGVPVLNSSDMTWNIVYSTFCDKNTTKSGTIAVYTLTEFKGVVLPLYNIPDDQISIIPTFNVTHNAGLLTYSVTTSNLACQFIVLGR